MMFRFKLKHSVLTACSILLRILRLKIKISVAFPVCMWVQTLLGTESGWVYEAATTKSVP